ncbi:MAG TPA: FGGY-family carbohydrate kinase [Feifaniaceae bacterium]|nr:FGGY-family carbohydrate kinase [Feifaniaceae bacterium]
MGDRGYILAYDVGTTALKTCLFSLDGALSLRAFAQRPYPLAVFPDGGAEQQPEDWWNAMCMTTKEALQSAGVLPGEIAGLSFCSQMQGLVLVDKDANPVRPAMSYMDQRAVEEYREGMAFGVKLSGINIIRLLRSLAITKAVAGSVKDPVWKYNWVRRNEPENFARVYKWLDVKEFLIARCTGEFVMTTDSAFATLLYDVRPGREGFSRAMCEMLQVNYAHLPRIIRSTEQAGGLTERAAIALGLRPGTPVFGGGGDASLIGVGAGAADTGSTHLYMGTSGWVSTVVDRPTLDISAMIAGVVGAEPGSYNYFAELETAGKCLEWVKDHLALDEIGVYLQKVNISDGQEAAYRSLYDYMMHVIAAIPAGSNGVIFTPWLHGNRCPFEDANARGMFFNIGIETGKTELIRSVVEGVCYHMRWMLEAQEKKVKTSPVIRFVGGGALAPLTCRILADVLGRPVETVEDPQNVGAVGAALVAAVGLGVFSGLSEAKALVPACCRYEPDPENKAVYDKGFAVFKSLYAANKKNFAALNKADAKHQIARAAAAIEK